MTGSGVGQLRTIETIDGKQIIERLDEIDPSGRFYRYTSLSGIPVRITPGRSGSSPKATAALSNGVRNFCRITSRTSS
jgi:hypothetical protein